jgi:hypothetical protein
VLDAGDDRRDTVLLRLERRHAAAVVMMGGRMRRLDLEGIEIAVDGSWERCDVELAAVGAYSVTVTTVVAQPVVLLVSSYVIDLAGHAAATHLWRGAGAREFGRGDVELGGVTYGRACLLDHAAQLHERLVAELGVDAVAVTVSDDALQAAEQLWAEPNAG